MIAEAMAIAAEAHAGQVDKGGQEYVLHPVAVMGLLDLCGVPEPYVDHLRAVALLHDTIEDCDPRDRLAYWVRIHSLGNSVAVAVEALTHRDHEGYESYIERVAANWMARRVKIADLSHNLDVTRMPDRELTDRDFDRWRKYRRALAYLRSRKMAL